MKKKNVPALLILVIAIAAGIFAYQQMLARAEREREQAEERARAQQQAQMDETRKHKMENLLNDFIHSVATLADEYKAKRKVLRDLVNPENLGSPEYVDENARLMQALIPELQGRMDAIMTVFRDTEGKVRERITDYDATAGEAILESWRKVRDDRATMYLAYFSSETDIFQAYQDMMAFYLQKKGVYRFDRSSGGLLFPKPEDKVTEQEMRQRIEDMESRQRQILKKTD